MYKFLCVFLLFEFISFSQNNLSAPEWFKGDHFVVYNKCKAAVLFCESTQQYYTFCGANKNCQGLYVMPGDTFFLNYEDKNQSMTIVSDISFESYLPVALSHTFMPVNNCIPPQALQIAIPISATPGSSFQINAQSPAYNPQQSFSPYIPLSIYVYVGGQRPNYTTALLSFTNCPAVEQTDTTAIDVSTKELNSYDMISLFPNPTEGILNVKLGIINDHSLLNIKLTDIVGREILNEAYKETITISYLERGIYFLSLYKNDHLVGTKKIVKE